MNSKTAPGSLAGKVTVEGRRSIGLHGKSYLAHRLVWLHVHGEWPEGEIDHINENPLDNRIENLRVATRSENQQNISKAQRNSRSGIRGVSPFGNRWVATIRIDGEQRFLGSFKTPSDAERAYVAAKRSTHVVWNGASNG